MFFDIYILFFFYREVESERTIYTVCFEVYSASIISLQTRLNRHIILLISCTFGSTVWFKGKSSPEAIDFPSKYGAFLPKKTFSLCGVSLTSTTWNREITEARPGSCALPSESTLLSFEAMQGSENSDKNMGMYWDFKGI